MSHPTNHSSKKRKAQNRDINAMTSWLRKKQHEIAFVSPNRRDDAIDLCSPVQERQGFAFPTENGLDSSLSGKKRKKRKESAPESHQDRRKKRRTEESSSGVATADVIDLTADDADVTPTILSDLYFTNAAPPHKSTHHDESDKLSHQKHYGGDPAQLGLVHHNDNFVHFFSLLDGKFWLNRLLLEKESISLFIEEIPPEVPKEDANKGKKSSKSTPKPAQYCVVLNHTAIQYLKYNNFIGAFIFKTKVPLKVYRVVNGKVQKETLSATNTTTTTSGGRVLDSAPTESASFHDLRDFDTTQQIFMSIKDLDEIEWSTLLAQWTSLLSHNQLDPCDKCDIYYVEDKYQSLLQMRRLQQTAELVCPVRKGRHILRSRFYEQRKEEENQHLQKSFWEHMYEHEAVQRSQNEIHILIENPNEVACKYKGIEITNADIYRMSPGQFLNDSVLDFFLSYFMDHYHNTTKSHIFNTQFYQLLKRDLKKCVQTIPRQRREGSGSCGATKIFDKDFIFIPANEGAHWSLFVVCYPNATTKSHPRHEDRCILSCDSMGEINHGVQLDCIHHYLAQRYALERGGNFPKLTLRYAQMPQQDNHFDCGFFLLSFVEFFLKYRLRNYKRVNLVADMRLTVNQKKQSLELREFYREQLLLVGTGTEEEPSAHRSSQSLDPLNYNEDWRRSQEMGNESL